MLLAPFEGSLVPASVREEVDALAFKQAVSVLAYKHSSVFPELNAESVHLVVAVLAVVAVSIRLFCPAQALALPF